MNLQDFLEKSEEELERELITFFQNADQPKRKPLHLYLNTVGKRVAAIAIVVGLFLALSACAFAIHLPNIQFFLTVREKFTELFFQQEDIDKAPDTIETVYTLGYVPEGYELVEQKIKKTYVKTTWSNINNQNIVLVQERLSTNRNFDNENSEYDISYIEDRQIVIYQKNTQTNYIWNDDNYIYSLTTATTINKEEGLLLLSSLTELSNLNIGEK